ncbi:hypothetical protein CRE_16212 [Caenorhabditis remanei]|uniref:Uncharacterized protein n=1 Tax=Caenorhabditis remanei TaxID=31234 RepID=E3MSL7_CAERE|nr:hypothetical protein CRE_16212 [Caenorhabditis remanei]
MTTEKLENDWKLIQDDFQKLEKIHDEYIQKCRQVSKFQDTAVKAMKHHNYLLKNFKETMKQTQQSLEKKEPSEEKSSIVAQIAKMREEMEVSNLRLRDMQGELPAQSNGFYLNLILGSNLNVSLLTRTEKFKYKQEYDGFKWNITILICALALIPSVRFDSVLPDDLVLLYNDNPRVGSPCEWIENQRMVALSPLSLVRRAGYRTHVERRPLGRLESGQTTKRS